MRRNLYFLFVGLLLTALALSVMAEEKKEPGGRDLFYKPPQGQQGSKVSIKLNRGGAVSVVPPTHKFRSGDQIRLVFATNFKGYAAVSNQGSTGATVLVYPPQGVSGQVNPSSNFEVPGQGWLQFDNKPGKEKLTVVMSASPMTEVTAAQGGASSAGSVSPQQQAEILAQLNGRALENAKKMRGGRDLSFVPEGDSVYVNSGSSVTQPWGFELLLIHE